MSSVSIPEKPVKFLSACRKKRCAPCVGWQPTISEPATSSATAKGEVPILTASGKKLALSLPSVSGGGGGDRRRQRDWRVGLAMMVALQLKPLQ